MKYVYFKINAAFSGVQADKFNHFMSSHAVASIEEHFVDDGQESFMVKQYR